nr:DNA helicase II [Chlamydiota bacterium]
TEENEASAVVQRLLHLKKIHNFRWKDCAILYRSNAIARPFEMALMQGMWQKNGEWKRGIPYQVFGGTELYERSEIKDLMAYLRLIANQRDEEALLRIINVPRRGISDKTLNILTQENRQKKVPLWQLLQNLRSHPELKERAIQAVQNFVHLIRKGQDLFATKPLKSALEEFLELIDYKSAIEEEVKSEKMQLFKWENVQSCIEALRLYQDQEEDPTLQDFLTTTLLDKNQFTKNETESFDRVNVMTFHSAKGLEFEAVFLVALEDHIIPHERSFHLEEERRLMYVAITRAKKYLNMSMAQQRKRYGKDENSSPSRFLFEIPKDLLKVISWRNPCVG